MARITLFWCFWTKIFLNGMMEFQVKFCRLSGLRLRRPWMLLSTKSKGHKSNFHISWMYRFCFYDLKVHFWWPNKCSKHHVLRLNTLYFWQPHLTNKLLSKRNHWENLISTKGNYIGMSNGFFQHIQGNIFTEKNTLFYR